MNIGFIEDDPIVLERNQNDNMYLFDGTGICLSTNGQIYGYKMCIRK